MKNNFLSRFQQHVEHHPESLALFTSSSEITYRELYKRSLHLAGSLKRLEIQKGDLVGLAFDKSADHIISLLGVWMAGAAFLPLDPNMPKDRLQFIIKDSGVKHIINRGMRAIDHQVNQKKYRKILPPPETSPDDLAYVVYTSGSVGRPKGVLVAHRGITNFLVAQIKAFRLKRESRTLQYLSTSFDASLSEIGTALLSGSALGIGDASSLKPGPDLIRLLKKWRITHLDLPPALLPLLKCSEMPDCLETIIIGGEVCPPSIVREWAQHFRVVNVYGPTEATVCTSLCECTPQWDRPLIGHPIPNVFLSIRDADLQPVSAGRPGELFIGGVGLAKGYLNQPELEAKKFLAIGKERVYRTGDRVVQHRDGEIEFLGRLDRQVKVHGQLLELEEIEVCLCRHPDVQVATVVQRHKTQEKGRKQIVAFIVLKKPLKRILPEHLKTHLERYLPKWMIPRHFVFLEKMPLIVNSKVDFHILSQCDLETRKTNEGFVQPATPLEKQLASIWEDVLEVAPVGVKDNFFVLGGDSLRIFQIVIAAGEKGISMTPEMMIHYPTIASLVTHLNDSRKKDISSSEGVSFSFLQKEAALDPDLIQLIEKSKRSPREDLETPRQILLTGATGFLGSELLVELTKKTAAKIHCLVRPGSQEKAGRPLSQTPRISVVLGDLSQPRFGLSRERWEWLSQNIDTVYHCGALVNFALPYSQLASTNVNGTREILRFLCQGKQKKLHYVSSLSVFTSTDRPRGVLQEDEALDHVQCVYGGYAQTKWVAERTLTHARDVGLNGISLYRLGLIGGNTRTGRFGKNDLLQLFLKGIVSLGSIPARGLSNAEAIKIDITPVDYAAATLVTLSLNPKNHLVRAFHIANPVSASLREIFSYLRSCGISIKEISTKEWRKQAEKVALKGSIDEMIASLSLRHFLSENGFERYRSLDLFQATGIEFGMKNTQAFLKDSGLSCPPLTRTLMATYLQGLSVSGKNEAENER